MYLYNRFKDKLLLYYKKKQMYIYKLTNNIEFINNLTNNNNNNNNNNNINDNNKDCCSSTSTSTTSSSPNLGEQYLNTITYSTKLNQRYRIIRYKKPILSKDLIPIYGIFRSVIINSLNNVVCFSPPKSLHADKFMEMYPVYDSESDSDSDSESDYKKNIIAQEFVEGTMINVFFDPAAASWQIATRSTVGGNMSFFQSSNAGANAGTNSNAKTFNEMFQEACVTNQLNIHALHPGFCYSFVLQHPCNRIVVPFSKPQLYLIEVYSIIHELDGSINVYPQDLSVIKQNGLWSATTIRFPETYEFLSYLELIIKFASPNTPYNIMGIVIRNTVTNERCKIRNPIYEEVRQLRGNQAKLQYQYLTLRKDGKIPEFIKFYPETKPELSKFRDQLHMFTNTLHQNYVSCYVKKEKPLKEFHEQYRTHMFKLHEHYLTHLRETKGAVTNTVVINYVNNLAPSLLMFCLNHNFRKRNVDTLKADLV